MDFPGSLQELFFLEQVFRARVNDSLVGTKTHRKARGLGRVHQIDHTQAAEFSCFTKVRSLDFAVRTLLFACRAVDVSASFTTRRFALRPFTQRTIFSRYGVFSVPFRDRMRVLQLKEDKFTEKTKKINENTHNSPSPNLKSGLTSSHFNFSPELLVLTSRRPVTFSFGFVVSSPSTLSIFFTSLLAVVLRSLALPSTHTSKPSKKLRRVM